MIKNTVKRKLRFFYFIAAMIFCCTANAQQLVNAAGSSSSNENGAISQSIGTSFYQSSSSESGQLTEGVLHLYQIIELPTSNKKSIALDLKAYPNPVSQELQLSYQSEKAESLVFKVSDINGRLLKTHESNTKHSTISFDQISDGVYFVQVFSGTEILKSFKIIKK